MHEGKQEWMTTSRISAIAASGLALSLICFGSAVAAGKPDLVILSHRYELTGECSPRKPVMEVTVIVENKGDAPAPAVRRPLLQVKVEEDANWGNSARLTALAPGESQTDTVPIYYFLANPDFMTARASHAFVITLDPTDLMEEADESNNETRSFSVPPPMGCL